MTVSLPWRANASVGNGASVEMGVSPVRSDCRVPCSPQDTNRNPRSMRGQIPPRMCAAKVVIPFSLKFAGLLTALQVAMSSKEHVRRKGEVTDRLTRAHAHYSNSHTDRLFEAFLKTLEDRATRIIATPD